MCVNIYVRERLTEDWFQMPSGRSIPGGLDHGPSYYFYNLLYEYLYLFGLSEIYLRDFA